MLPGGTEEGAEEIAEGVPRQEVRHVGEKGGGQRELWLLWIYIRTPSWSGATMHGACLEAVVRIQQAS